MRAHSLASIGVVLALTGSCKNSAPTAASTSDAAVGVGVRDGGAASSPQLSSCIVQGDATHLSFDFQTALASGGLTLRETEDAEPKARIDSTSMVFAQGSQMVITISSRTAHGQTRMTVDYGPAFQGVQHAEFRGDGTKLVGTVDGHDIAPISLLKKNHAALDVTFRDHTAPVKVTLTPEIQLGMESLLQQAETGIPRLCVLTATAADAGASVPHAPTVKLLSPDDVPDPVGTGGSTDFSQGCSNCTNNCDAALAVCDGTIAIGCIATLWGYGACAFVGFIGCSAAAAICWATCYNGGAACCPTQCSGTGVCCGVTDQCTPGGGGCCPNYELICGGMCCDRTVSACNGSSCCPQNTVPCGPTCCGAGEQCADSAHGVCCPAGVATCGGGCCDNTDEVCASAHPLVCCVPGDVACGDQCCGTGQTCKQPGNQCCAGALCGGFCCDEGTCLNGQCCYGAVANGVCCGIAEQACGGSCCSGTCINGACCPDTQVACGNVCCAPGSACKDPSTSTCSTCPAGQEGCKDPVTGDVLCCASGACCNGACCGTGQQCCVRSCETNCIIP